MASSCAPGSTLVSGQTNGSLYPAADDQMVTESAQPAPEQAQEPAATATAAAAPNGAAAASEPATPPAAGSKLGPPLASNPVVLRVEVATKTQAQLLT